MAGDAPLGWTDVQQRRLKDLGASKTEREAVFSEAREREKAFLALDRRLVAAAREELSALRAGPRRPGLSRLEARLVEALTAAGFVQVTTPILLARGLLARMTITDDHPLASQVFWVDEHRCLRPMLAPNLYYMLVDLLRIWERPVRIFEVGPCFRKESQGAQHLNEFTMLNLVEMGLPLEDRDRRMEDYARLVMDATGVRDWRIEVTESEVYGKTVDIVTGAEGVELGSGAMGPHALDVPWGVTDPWVGIGFGLERLLVALDPRRNVKSVGRALGYLDGVRLNI